MGLFDDIVPPDTAPVRGGLFDDIVPPARAPRARPLAAPVRLVQAPSVAFGGHGMICAIEKMETTQMDPRITKSFRSISGHRTAQGAIVLG